MANDKTTFDETSVGQWLTPTQASHLLDCSPEWVRILVKSGRLRGVVTGLGLLVDPRDLDRLRAERDRHGDGAGEGRA